MKQIKNRPRTMDSKEIEARAIADMGDKTITIEMLRDYIYEAFSAEKRSNEAKIQSIRFGMDATPERKARWQKANINLVYRMEQLRIALIVYNKQINKL